MMKININTESYIKIVDDIEKCSEKIIDSSTCDIDADAEALSNNVMPCFEDAQNQVNTILKKLQEENDNLVITMKNIRDNYEGVDEDAFESAIKLER